MSDRRILVTNDDGIDSVGLHVLARTMQRFGRVSIVAPASEYSGAGASIGALHQSDPEIRRVDVDGIDTSWTVTGPPGLCVFYARMGAFGFKPDFVVSGINPGANLGRAVYHSGTIGAVLTGRNGNIPGIAVSQKFAALEAEGGPEDGDDTDPQATDGEISQEDYDAMVAGQLWDSAAEVASGVVDGMLTAIDDGTGPEIGALNLNVPNLPIDEIKGWRWTEVGLTPPWSVKSARLIDRADGRPLDWGTAAPVGPPEGRAYRMETTWGENPDQPTDTDSAAIMDDQISVSWLSRIVAVDDPTPAVADRLDGLLGRWCPES